MTIKLSEVIGNIDSIKALQEVKFPVKVSYRIKRLVDKLEPIVKAYNEKRHAIISELGQPDGKGNIAIPKEDTEKLAEYAKRLQELLDVEETIDFEKVNIESLPETVTVEPKLLLINWIFE